MENIILRLKEEQLSQLILLATFAVIIFEFFLIYGYRRIGIYGHIAILVICVFVPEHRPHVSIPLGAVALLPLFRLIAEGLPVFTDKGLHWLFVLYFLMFISMLIFIRKNQFSIATRWVIALKLSPLAIGLGLLFSLVYSTIFSESHQIMSTTSRVGLSITILIFIGFIEELLFRGIIQGIFIEYTDLWTGVAITTVLFGIMHGPSGGFPAVFFGFVSGLVLCVTYVITNSLIFNTILHSSMNIFIFSGIPTWGAFI